jgi:hypothetical protein
MQYRADNERKEPNQVFPEGLQQLRDCKLMLTRIDFVNRPH